MNESDAGTTPPAAERPDDEERSSSRSGARASRSGRRIPLWLDTAITMIAALIIAVLVKTFLIQPFYIPSASMNPTLVVNDQILVSKLTPGVFDLQRGDVVVFEDPADWIESDVMDHPTPRTRLMQVLSVIGLAPDPSQDFLVKRLIGLPGDHVQCEAKDAPLMVNGVELDEPYINQATTACQTAFDITVPEGDVWVMGDNRHASADSAYHEAQGEEAYVPLENVTGRAVVVFWPISSWSGLGGGHDSFDDVPDPS